MILRICARLSLVVGVAGLVQIPVHGQATLTGAAPQFGAEPAPYAQLAQPPVPAAPPARGIPAAQPVEPFAGGYSSVPAVQAPAPGGESMADFDPSKPLSRGDTVTFTIVQDREAPQIMRVTDTGELDFSQFPKIGRISVAGKTCSQVAGDLKRKLEADYYNAADVQMGINQVAKVSTLGTIYVSGNVRVPGPESILPGERMTVSTAIIRAGGFDKYADERKVQVTRKGKDGRGQRFAVDVKSIIKDGRLDRDVELHDGDYINVPQNWINY